MPVRLNRQESTGAWPTIDESAASIICDEKYSCQAGIIRGCRSVICSGVASCADTQILDLPDHGTVTCAGDKESIACKSIVIAAALGATNVTVECNGDCLSADITGAQKVECNTGSSCGYANIRNIVHGGTVSCSQPTSCFEATIGPAENASITIACSGSSDPCQRATLDAGEDGAVDCVGGCSVGEIVRTKTVSCPTEQSCGGTNMKSISNGGTVTCSGKLACLSADI